MKRTAAVLSVLAVLMLMIAPAGAKPSSAESASLIQDVFPIEGAEGSVTIHRKANGTLTWKLRSSGLTKGHAYTVWVGNFDGGDGRTFFNDGGHGAGGIVGGSGNITATGNHCVRPLDPSDPAGTTGGFIPGAAPDCDIVEVDAQVGVFLIDHGPWEQGEQTARRTPLGGGFAGDMFVFFPAA